MSSQGRQKFENPKSHSHFGFSPVSLCWATVEVASEPSGFLDLSLSCTFDFVLYLGQTHRKDGIKK